MKNIIKLTALCVALLVTTQAVHANALWDKAKAVAKDIYYGAPATDYVFGPSREDILKMQSYVNPNKTVGEDVLDVYGERTGKSTAGLVIRPKA